MIPRRNRDLPFGRNSFLFSYKRRYNGNLCACSVQQAKTASSMMPCTLSAPAAYFLPTTVLCARNVSPTAYFLSTAAKSMKKCRQKPMVSGLPLPSRGLLVMRPSRELTQQQTRCRSHSSEENITFTAGEYGSPQPVCGLSAPSCQPISNHVVA